eukprot:797824-Rhodomonas_salina.1
MRASQTTLSAVRSLHYSLASESKYANLPSFKESTWSMPLTVCGCADPRDRGQKPEKGRAARSGR